MSFQERIECVNCHLYDVIGEQGAKLQAARSWFEVQCGGCEHIETGDCKGCAFDQLRNALGITILSDIKRIEP